MKIIKFIFISSLFISLNAFSQDDFITTDDLITAKDSTEEGKRKLAQIKKRNEKWQKWKDAQKDTTPVFKNTAQFNNSLLFSFVDNPAYTGQEGLNNFNAEYVYSPFYRQQTFSYDIRYNSVFKKRREKLTGRKTKGLGFYLQSEQQFGFKRLGVGLISFSRHYKIKNKAIISFGLNMQYLQNVLDFNKMTFTDQIDPKNGFQYAHSENQGNNRTGNINTSVGTSLRTHKFYLGLFAQNITQPNESVTSGNSRLPMAVGLNVSRTIKLNQNLVLKPEIYMKRRSTEYFLLVNHFVLIEKSIFGIGYQSHNLLYTDVGYLYKRIRFMLISKIRISRSNNEKTEINTLRLNIRYHF